MTMDIKLGKFNTNKTYKYLLPIINTFSNEFAYHYNLIKDGFIASAIGDAKYGDEHEHALFILFDMNGKYDVASGVHISPTLGRSNFNAFLNFCRKYRFYINDYYFKSFTDITHSVRKENHLCCVIYEIPDSFKNSVNEFKNYKYSKMYSATDLKRIKIPPQLPNGQKYSVWSVLTKDKAYKQKFTEILNTTFNTNIEIDDDREFDLPYNKSEEIFNYDVGR